MTVGVTDYISNPLLEQRIMAAIEGHLAAKGIDRVDNPESATFVVAFTVGSREKIRVDTYPTYYVGYGHPYGWGRAYYGMGIGTETRVRQYEKGILAVDIFDAAEHRPMWHSVATKSITEADRRAMDATIEAAVDAALAAFPPG